MEIRVDGAALVQADRWTDGYYEVQRHFLRLWERA